MPVCYWCGEEVREGQGAREHIVPATLLQDVSGDISDFVIPKENAHQSCNQMLGRSYEHDFCQLIFHYSFGDPKAQKHNDSKIRNLQRMLNYAANQFARMQQKGNHTQITLSDNDKKSFEESIKKILKGLYFKKFNQYLDLEDEYSIRIIWNTLNIEHDRSAKEQVKQFLALLNDEPFQGNEVFKFRFKKTQDASSYIWEFVFYDRFPVYVFLIHKNDKQVLSK
jgi:hypothetical protein